MVLAVIFVFLRPGKRFPTLLRVTVILFVFLSVICLIGAIIYFTVINKDFELGFLENYLRFGDKWATERGEIWRMTMESYADLPLIRKLFGCGPDTLSLLLREKFEAQMSASGEFVDNAHNEFMNYLVNHGIVGLGFYLSPDSACRIGMFSKGLRDKIKALGNTALQGAIKALCDLDAIAKMEAIAARVKTVNLNESAFFSERFMDAIFFEES